MQFKTHFKNLTIAERLAFAERVNSTKGHLQNVANGSRPCSPALAVAIEFETNSEVTRRDLLPNDWKKIWPELAAAGDCIACAAIESDSREA